jgi:hypothetical protein
MPRLSAEFRVSARERAAVIAVCLAAGALGALALGQDVSGDLYNYHFYNGWALLSERLDRDLAPAGNASYFNPVLDVMHYLGVRYVPPRLFGALMGAFQSLNVGLVWAIARRLLGPKGQALALVAAVLAGLGQNAVGLLGTTYGDNSVSIPALAALLVTMGETRPGPARLAIAGFLGGAATGLKLTVAPAHLGLGILTLWLAFTQRRPSLLSAFALGSAAGWGVTSGWWALELWRRFRNPLYPFFNGLFHSPYGSQAPTWSPLELSRWLQPAVDAALGVWRQLQEVPLRDTRLLVTFLALAIWLAATWSRVRRGQRPSVPACGLVLYWLSAYAGWVAVFHYYRYAVVIELLAPLVALALLLDAWPGRPAVVAAVLAATLLLTSGPTPWWRAPNWSPYWFRARLPPLALEADQLVLLPEMKTSFAAPFFPATAAFIGLVQPEYRGEAMTAAIRARLARHNGPFCVLARSPETHVQALCSFGLTIASNCDWLSFGRGHRLLLCPLERFATDGRVEATCLRP